METTATIPSSSETQTIVNITLIPGSTNVGGTIRTPDGRVHKVNIDVSPEWAGVSAANKTIIKTFIKRLGVLILDKFNEDIGVDVGDADVTGEIWD